MKLSATCIGAGHSVLLHILDNAAAPNFSLVQGDREKGFFLKQLRLLQLLVTPSLHIIKYPSRFVSQCLLSKCCPKLLVAWFLAPKPLRGGASQEV
jgi:hypothetical protein